MKPYHYYQLLPQESYTNTLRRWRNPHRRFWYRVALSAATRIKISSRFVRLLIFYTLLRRCQIGGCVFFYTA